MKKSFVTSLPDFHFNYFITEMYGGGLQGKYLKNKQAMFAYENMIHLILH